MRKRKEEPPPQRPNPNFDAELSPQVGSWVGLGDGQAADASTVAGCLAYVVCDSRLSPMPP